jgi:Polyketide cyclase / dehydrase and lipid transport
MGFGLILLAIGAFLFWVSRRPDDFSISRQVNINALPSDVFPWVNNLKNMNQWNPWATQDPKSVISYEGPEEGPGAIYNWAGGKMGSGQFTIVDVKAPTELNCRLQMIRPIAANNQVNYSITERDGVTNVVWAMSGKNSFLNKLMQTFFSMDKMVGKEFERGLGNLKRLVEQKKVN